jgi:uncharacterized protein YneF (UPF0154 family)
MLRQILAVAVGVVLSFLFTAVVGYVLSQFSSRSPDELPALARYVGNPIIALVVGTCVGVLAKRQPGLLAGLSLAPWAVGFVVVRHQDAVNAMILVLDMVFCVFFGMVAARFIFSRTHQQHPAI